MRTCLAVALVIAGAAGVSFGARRARVRQPPAVEERDDSAVDAPEGREDADDDEERVPAPAPRAPALPSSGAASPASAGTIQ